MHNERAITPMIPATRFFTGATLPQSGPAGPALFRVRPGAEDGLAAVGVSPLDRVSPKLAA
jgi:hypothetical protein